MTSKERTERIDALRKRLGEIFAEAGPELDLDKVRSIDGDAHSKAQQIRKMNDELAALVREQEDEQALRKAAENLERLRETPPMPTPERQQERVHKGIGQLFVESDAYKLRAGGYGPPAELDVDVKALFQTTAGWPPDIIRSDIVVPAATRPIRVLDIIPTYALNQAALTYMEETTFTNAAAETAEGGAYPEAADALTEKTSPVRKIAVFIPVTDEQLEDVEGVQEYLERRLTFMLRQRLDGQVLTGNGAAPNLTGILNTSGIQTQARDTDPVPDAVYKAIVKVRVTGRAEPNAFVVHPSDWQDVRLLRTADGIYIWGSPSEPGPERIWGLTVVQSDAIPENTGLVGDFANYCGLWTRRGVEVQVSDSHADYFASGKKAIRADVRVAFAVLRATAFCTVTGI